MPRPWLALLLALLAPLVLAAGDGRDLGAAQPAVVVEGKRVALVIGNGGYAHAGRLAQAPTDAKVMAAALRELGFTVIERYDQPLSGMARAAADFDAALNGAAVGAFYYAGHAVQVEGKNYLVPVDADLQNPRYVDAEALDMARLMRTMDDAGSQLNLVVLDACRNNPWEGRWTTVDRALGDTRGLAQVSAPRGFIVAYATGPGDVAADNGVYAAALAERMRVPGREIVDVFRDVFAEVTHATRDDQVPWVSVAMSDRFYPAGSAGGSSEPLEVTGSGSAGSSADIGSFAACARELADQEASLKEQAAADWTQIEPLLARKDALTKKAVDAWYGKWGPGKPVATACGERSTVSMSQAATAQAWLSSYRDTGDWGREDDGGGASSAGHAGIEWVAIPGKSYELSRSEVTFGQYQACVSAGACTAPHVSDGTCYVKQGSSWSQGTLPSSFQGSDQPVVCVDWEQATAYASWAGGRLPTETEWEYAAKGGQSYEYAGSDNVGEVAWYDRNSGGSTHDVCGKKRNGYGLCDMSGNVWEWTSTAEGSYRVLRGGSWVVSAARVRVANRRWSAPSYRYDYVGFRLAR